MSEPTSNALLSVHGLNAAYRIGDRYLPAVRDWSLSLGRGEVAGILGESGTGKTTVALALLGLLPRDALVTGSACFEGRELIGASESELRKIRGARISLIQQEPLLSLNPVIRVVDQVAEVLRAHVPMRRAELEDRSRAALLQAGLDGEALQNAYPHQLSGGQRQRVLIAQAIVCKPSLIIADEPTGALDAASALEVFRLLQNLVRELNASLILITHDPRLLAAIADTVLVMQAGTIVEAGPAREVLRSPHHPYTQSLLRPWRDPAIPRAEAGTAPLLLARGLTKTFRRRHRLLARHLEVPALRGVDLDLRAGRTLAIVGPSGAGKSTLARALAGLDPADAGELLLDGHTPNPETIHRRIQMIFQDPGASLNPRFTVAEALSEPLAIRGQSEAARRSVADRLRQVGLPEDAAPRFTSQLSGGQKARLALARALAALDDQTQPCILILDESLASLDLSVQAQIVHLLKELQKQRSLAYILIAHDLTLVAHLADEVAVLSEGRIVERGAQRELFEHANHPHFRALLAATLALEENA